MILGSLALTISTTLGGTCGEIANFKNIEAIKESANEIILAAANNYDYSEYDLTYDEHQSFVKQKLYQYAKNNKLFGIEELENLKTSIESDPNYTHFENIDALFIKKNENPKVINDTMDLTNKNLFDKLNNFSFAGNKQIDDVIVKNNFTDISYNTDLDGNSGSSSSGNTSNSEEKFPILSYDSNKVSTSINGTVDGCNFLGILCSKDACINLYNIFAGWLNRKEMFSAVGRKTPVGFILDEVKNLKEYANISVPIITAAIAKITGFFSVMWSEYCSLFTAGGPVGFIIGTVIAIIGADCIAVIVTMIVYGFLKKGFAIGWKFHYNILPDWFCGELY